MTSHERRTVLRTVSVVAAGGALAGCTEGLLGDDGSDEKLRDGATVDYPAMADGEASVRDGDDYIEYEDPAVEFELDGRYEGEPHGSQDLRVSRDLSGQTRTVFVAPVHTGEGFRFHFFANERFVETADWNLLVVKANDEIEGRGSPGFERLEGDVYEAVVEPGDVRTVVVADVTASELREGASNATGIGIIRRNRSRVRETAPNVQFTFDYRPDSAVLEVMHDGGDRVDATELSFRAEGEVTVVEDFGGDTVRAGDTASLDVSGASRVRVVWERGEQTSTLASWEKPAG